MAVTKYSSWTTEALVAEVKRLKELMKHDIAYVKATRKTQLTAIARELERRRNR